MEPITLQFNRTCKYCGDAFELIKDGGIELNDHSNGISPETTRLSAFCCKNHLFSFLMNEGAEFEFPDQLHSEVDKKVKP